jgi:hypothetical protein
MMDGKQKLGTPDGDLPLDLACALAAVARNLERVSGQLEELTEALEECGAGRTYIFGRD